MNNNNYVCNSCGTSAYYDGRCGDGPILMCGCDKRGSVWVNDGRGGYYTNPTNAQPIESENYYNPQPNPYDTERR